MNKKLFNKKLFIKAAKSIANSFTEEFCCHQLVAANESKPYPNCVGYACELLECEFFNVLFKPDNDLHAYFSYDIEGREEWDCMESNLARTLALLLTVEILED